VKNDIQYEILHYNGELPAVIIRTHHTTFGFAYNSFTDKPYTKQRRKLSEKDRMIRVSDFLDWFALHASKQFILMGDFNCNWFEGTTFRNKIFNWCLDNDATQVINSPTRVVGDSSTLLDLCITRIHKMKSTHHIRDLPFSDHKGLFLQFGRRNIKSSTKVIHKWNFSLDLVEHARLHPLNLSNPDQGDIDSMSEMLTKWLRYYEDNAKSSRKIHENPLKNSWCSSDLKKLKLKYTTATNDSDRKFFRNAYVSGIRRAKSKYQKDFILKHKQHGGVWKLLRKPNNYNEQSFIIDNLHTNNKNIIANEFKNTFTSKVHKLRKNPDTEVIIKHLKERLGDVESWDLRDCTEEEVANCIDKLKPSASTGPDGVSNRTIKILKHQIIKPLTIIINTSIQSGCFPDSWKIGRVCPVHKRGAKNDTANYRPVTLTSNIGKIVESVIRMQLSEAFEKVFPDNMHGFRPNRGTESALLELLEKVKSLKCQNKKVAILALDASAAFDVLSHKLILRSLEAIGAGPILISWMTNYLSGCTQFVDVQGTHSETWTIDIGVGQGKRLSADLFNLGTLSNALWTCLSFLVQYADDGGDVISGSTEAELNDNIRATALARTAWFNHAGLTLNASKSELIGFGLQPNPLIIDGHTIHPSSSIKFLGLTIQSNLNFQEHVDNISNKMRSAAGRLRAECRHLDISDKRIIFNGWIRSLPTCNALAYLPHLNASQLQQLNAAYNSGIRSIFKLPKKGYAPISDLCARIKLPTIFQIKNYTLLLEAWKRRSSFDTNFKGPTTRGRSNLNVPLPNTKGMAGKCLSNIICNYWNDLPLSVKVESCPIKAKNSIRKLAFNF